MSTHHILRAASVFLTTFGAFRTYTALVSPRYPKLRYHVYVGRNKRRLHHWESGLYIAAIGAALFLEDIKDVKLTQEYKV